MTPPRLLAPSELAARWSMSTKQILQLCREGLPHARLNARVIRIPDVDATAWLVAYTTRPKSAQVEVDMSGELLDNDGL